MSFNAYFRIRLVNRIIITLNSLNAGKYGEGGIRVKIKIKKREKETAKRERKKHRCQYIS